MSIGISGICKDLHIGQAWSSYAKRLLGCGKNLFGSLEIFRDELLHGGFIQARCTRAHGIGSCGTDIH